MSDAVHTRVGPLLQERYVTDVANTFGLQRFLLAVNGMDPRYMIPKANIYRRVLIFDRLDLALYMRVVTVTALV